MLRASGQIPAGGWHRKLTAQVKRKYALKCLATMADLTQDHRRRVLEFACKINEV